MQTAGKLIWMFYKFTLFLLCLSEGFLQGLCGRGGKRGGAKKDRGKTRNTGTGEEEGQAGRSDVTLLTLEARAVFIYTISVPKATCVLNFKAKYRTPRDM